MGEISTVRVMVVIDSLGQGGAEESLLATLPLVASGGVEPQVVLLRSVDETREQQLRDAGVAVRVLGCASGPVAVARALRPVLRAERPDVLHVTLFDPIVGGAVAALGTGVRVLASQVNTPPDTRATAADTSGARWKVRVARWLEAVVCRRMVTHLHAVTPGVRDTVAEAFHIPSERITVAERGRDADRFGPADPRVRAEVRAELGVPAEATVVVALGRHEPSKAFPDLVAAAALLTDRIDGLHVLLAGREGTDSSRLRAAIADAGLEGRFHLLGVRADPERVLATADVFVLSSLREGTSGAMLEAMASALPIVATDLAGLRGIAVDGENAVVVPPSRPDRLAEAITEVVSDPDLAGRIAEAGRHTYLERFTIERSAAALAALYRSVAAGTSS